MPQVRKWVEYQCEGAVLNLFAGPTKLSINEVRIDADQKMPADYHMDCREFVEYATQEKIKFDTVIMDPPYTWRKSKEMYNGNMVGQFPRLKNELIGILSKQAKILQFADKKTLIKIGISVGAIIAICAPLSAIKAAESNATIVLPQPTSPCNNLFICVFFVKSALISLNALTCALVNEKLRF